MVRSLSHVPLVRAGHLVGPGERELRYQVLVQRGCCGASTDPGRRILCLSAILPEGQQLDDLTAWIRSDAEGTSVKSEWEAHAAAFRDPSPGPNGPQTDVRSG